MATFKDHFSASAAGYAVHRPRYPDALVDFLAEQAPGHKLALDAGCGTGQLSVLLARRFRRVIATDASARQIEEAEPHPGIEYRVAPAEQSGLEDGSADLFTVAQAAHWFELSSFYEEVRRILRPGGSLIITTPNITSSRAIAASLLGYHSGFFPAYIKPSTNGEHTDARHNREYTAREVYLLFHDAGFDVTRLDTGEFKSEPKPEHIWVEHMLDRYGMGKELRGDGIYAVGRKAGPVRSRWPAWLYS